MYGTKRQRADSPQHSSEDENTNPAKRLDFLKASKSQVPSPKASPMKIPLPLPHPTDTAQSLTTKLNAILASLASGQSIAATTGFLATGNPNRDAVSRAEQQMPPGEREVWDAYKSDQCAPLPSIDWTTSTDPAPTSARPLKTARRRAEALNRLYSTDQVQPGHAVSFTRNHEMLLPLVKAVARIIGVERDIVGGGQGAVTGGGALADLQTVNEILRVLGEFLEKQKGAIDGTLVAQAQAALGAERRRLRELGRG